MDVESARRAQRTTDAALAFIDREAASAVPFFLLAHYFDAHLPYDPPLPFRERFADPADRAGKDPALATQRPSFRGDGAPLEARLVRRLEKLYDGEVGYLDQEVGRLLAGLTGRRLDGNTVVVVTADHGEEFLEHGGFEHGHTLYDEQLHVPLLVRAPGLGRPASSVPTVVRLIDVAPTLCALAGVTAPESFAGQSLVSQLQRGPGPDRPLIAQATMWGDQGEAMRARGLKLIRYRSSSRVELYDVGADPGERRDLSAEWPEKRSAMLRELFVALEAGTVRRPEGRAALTEEQRERLRALGYLQ
ncbi:MAG TPA: sulfatase-like hydrolase/transferase [Vicinamibacteria bacterium]|nr:sulfatase-like hydrolase/transferase [Vicinamibacteria bacterium]